VAKGVPGGYRIWDTKARRWWGDHYELCPDELLSELNDAADHAKITMLLKKRPPALAVPELRLLIAHGPHRKRRATSRPEERHQCRSAKSDQNFPGTTGTPTDPSMAAWLRPDSSSRRPP
jgi:hypothetical protein